VKRQLVPSQAFLRTTKRYLKRRPKCVSALEATLALLAEDAFDARLKTHKLKGNFAGTWACSAGYDLRILFEFVLREGEEVILLLTLGSHGEVY